MDEGVTNVEALAHHDIVELILTTRIPVPRLLDWLDQAILHLHLGETGRSTLLKRLRKYGIRTATDLVKACKDEGQLAQLEKVFACSAKQPEPASQKQGDEALGRLGIIRDSLKDEEWMQHLLNWHRPQHIQECHLPMDEKSLCGPSPSASDSRRAAGKGGRSVFKRAFHALRESAEPTPH
jgi:hypothetical protein